MNSFNLNIQLVSMFEKKPPPADIVVLDEAHHDATDSSANIYSNSGNQLTLGLSATPLRTDKRKLSFEAVVNEIGIQRLINEKYLAPYKLYIIPDWEPATVARIYLEDRERWGKSLAFFHKISECREFDRILKNAGIKSDVVTATSDRDRQLEQFETGRTDIISNVMVLTEGFDLPELQSIFVRDASRLPTIQMAGRGLRKSDAKIHCSIIQSQNTKYSFQKTAKPIDMYLLEKKQWLSISGNSERIDETLLETAKILSTGTSVSMPRFFKSRNASIKDYYRKNRWDWDKGLRDLKDTQKIEDYLRHTIKVGDAYQCIDSARAWMNIFENREEARQCIRTAEIKASTNHMKLACSESWWHIADDPANALRHAEESLESVRSNYYRKRYREFIKDIKQSKGKKKHEK